MAGFQALKSLLVTHYPHRNLDTAAKDGYYIIETRPNPQHPAGFSFGGNERAARRSTEHELYQSDFRSYGCISYL